MGNGHLMRFKKVKMVVIVRLRNIGVRKRTKTTNETLLVTCLNEKSRPRKTVTYEEATGLGLNFHVKCSVGG